MRRVVLLIVIALLLAVAAQARIGGGQTYSGPSSGSSRSSGGGGGGGGSSYGGGGSSSYTPSDYGSSSSSSSSSSGAQLDGCVVALIFFIIVVFIVAQVISKQGESTEVMVVDQPAALPRAAADMSALRRFDPNFSEIVFTDFCYSLFARVYEALGRGELDRYAPYVDSGVRNGLKAYATGVTSVDEIVIGSFAIISFRLGEIVQTQVEYEANYVETKNGAARRCYIRDRWTLTRSRDVLSPTPEKAKAEHCPKCGAPLETRTDGACMHCGTIIHDGSFQWFVRSISTLSEETLPPDLSGGGPEVGTDYPTRFQPNLAAKRKSLEESQPNFSWTAFLERVRLVANELQAAWTSRHWQRAQKYETGALFQMHRYWIDEYLRQGLRNVVDDFTVSQIVIVKVSSDAFFDAITVRLYASGRDYMVNEQGTIVGGGPSIPRHWSEYWTFVRGRAGAAPDARVCPNCGAPRGEGQSVVCEFCGGKIVSGEFPWILSRIEQDEAYRG